MTLGDSYLSDFYRYDDPLEAPGKLLRQERLNEKQSNPGAAHNFRLLYSSTDGIDGEDLLPVSGALFLPVGKAPSDGWPLMAWTHGTVGIADICAPSWNGRQRQDRDHIEFWLTKGFAVVASDYQGLGTAGTHPYLATRPEAYSNLDIIRAVQSDHFPVSDKVVLFGQSQGAGAAIATAAYASSYAPDLHIVGAVATGVPFFSPKALIALQESRPPDRVDPMLAYNMLALSLVQRTDPSFVLTDYMTKEALPIARSIENTCHKDVRSKVASEELTYDRTFKKSPSGHLATAFARMGYPTLKLAVPTFVGTGGKDKDTPPRMQAAFAARACQAGSTIVSKLYPDLDHRGVVPGSTADTLPFVRAAFSGSEISSNCDRLPF
ncbi:alpha/beta fold hydrolase [Parasphingorhabdus sp.]|uniref:alpha/beta fold hydrolase n=1 Tax=Parasphingorhabdus sp. TaxID=2709688 RepID=UPI003265A54B